MDKALAKKAAAAAAEKIRGTIRRDRDHRVRLIKPFVVGRFPETFRGHRFPAYATPDFVIDADRMLTVLPDPAGELPDCDGATGAPDKIGGIDIAPGYIPHDKTYRHLKAMAKDPAWTDLGWTYDDLRAAFDMVLGAMIKREEDRAAEKARESGSWLKRAYHATIGAIRPISRIYHGAVRVFGGMYNAARIVVLAALLALAVGWSGGCAVPPGFEPGDDDPVYEIVPLAEGR